MLDLLTLINCRLFGPKTFITYLDHFYLLQDRLFEGSAETFKRFGSPFDLKGDENCDTIGFFMAKFVKL